jgi:hypothetical protein
MLLLLLLLALVFLMLLKPLLAILVVGTDGQCSLGHRMPFKLSVSMTAPAYLLEIEGLFTQGSRPGRTIGESVGGMMVMDSSDWSTWIRHHWSNGIRCHIFDPRPDTEFNSRQE